MRIDPRPGIVATVILALVVCALPSADASICLDRHLEVTHPLARPSEPFDYELVAQANLVEYSLTIGSLGDLHEHRARAQIIRHRSRHAGIEARLREFVARLPGHHVDQSTETMFRVTLEYEDEIELRVKLARAHELLVEEAPEFKFGASPLRESATRFTDAEVRRVVAAFLARHLEHPPALDPKAFADLKHDFFRELTAREETYFDWEIFKDHLGLRAAAKLQIAAARWRSLDPTGARPVDEVHADVRVKMLNVARRETRGVVTKSLLRTKRSDASLTSRKKPVR